MNLEDHDWVKAVSEPRPGEMGQQFDVLLDNVTARTFHIELEEGEIIELRNAATNTTFDDTDVHDLVAVVEVRESV